MPGAASSLFRGSLDALTLANDDQALAFQWQPGSAGAPDIYVAASAAADWVSEGTVLTDPSGQPYDVISPVISANGRAVYVTAAQPEPTGGPHWNRLLEVPVDGGQPRVLFELRYQPGAAIFSTHGGRCAATLPGDRCSRSPPVMCTGSRSNQARS